MNTTENEPQESSCPELRSSGAVSVPATTNSALGASFVGGDMKYTILISQIGLSESGLLEKIDLVDAVILDYLHCWSTSSKRKIGTYEGEEYFWVNFNHLIEELPILGIREKSRLSERFKKLRALGLIKSFQYKDNTLYVRLLCGDMFFAKKRGVLRQTEQGVTPSVTGGVTPDGTAQASNQIKPLTSKETPLLSPNGGRDRQSVLTLHIKSLGINPEILWPIWEKWIRCKQGKKFKNLEAEQAGITHLINLANKDIDLAQRLVDHAISLNWQGLYWPKEWQKPGEDGIAPRIQSFSAQPLIQDPLDVTDIYTCKSCHRQLRMTKRLYKGSTLERYRQCSECFETTKGV